MEVARQHDSPDSSVFTRCARSPSLCAQITRPAPANLACRCDLVKVDVSEQGVCKGTVVLCKNPLSPACLKPSEDLASCEQGKGKCLY